MITMEVDQKAKETIELSKSDIISDVADYENNHSEYDDRQITAIEGCVRYLLNKYYPEENK